MKAKKVIFVILIPILTLGISSAEIYKWVDENGVIHYSDSPTQNIPEPTDPMFLPKSLVLKAELLSTTL